MHHHSNPYLVNIFRIYIFTAGPAYVSLFAKFRQQRTTSTTTNSKTGDVLSCLFVTSFNISFYSDTQITMAFDHCEGLILPATTVSNPRCFCDRHKTGDEYFTYSVSSSGAATLTPLTSRSPEKLTPWEPACDSNPPIWAGYTMCSEPVDMMYGDIPLGSAVCCASDSDAKKCASASGSDVACAGCRVSTAQLSG